MTAIHKNQGQFHALFSIGDSFINLLCFLSFCPITWNWPCLTTRRFSYQRTISASSSPAKSEEQAFVVTSQPGAESNAQVKTKWVASSTLQRRWASERIRNRKTSLSEPTDQDDPCTRFDQMTDSLMEIDRSTCKAHADYKKSFISMSILKVILVSKQEKVVTHKMKWALH